MSRPEHTGAPELFYNETESIKYTVNSRIQAIQTQMTERALEILSLPSEKSCYILDIGCGSGLSGECLDENGHWWVGMDISKHMLDVANERDIDGDLFNADIGQGVPFKPGTFDGAISISVIQWLCVSATKAQVPQKRLARFFSTLYSALSRGARAVFQFYPENSAQLELIVNSAMKAGFTGGVLVDYPNSSKAKKYFLCLFAGYRDSPHQSPQIPAALGDANLEHVSYSDQLIQRRQGKTTGGKSKRTKSWIQAKKDLARKRGIENVPSDSKFTGRKRRVKF